ncbi:MAG: UDP-3-O-acyl-N-acetylglucosamine deacetylase [Pseudomonadota bacterium]
MSVSHQTTLAKRVSCQGVGVHSGKRSSMSLWPAQTNTGILFRRSDILEAANGPDAQRLAQASIPALRANVSETRLCTSVANSHGAQVATIEHLMAAFYGMGVDNALVEVDGPEIPIMDGSAGPFIDLIERAGLKRQRNVRRALKITQPLQVRSGESVISAEPLGEGTTAALQLTVSIDFDDPAIGVQQRRFEISASVFQHEIARARTFGFLEDVRALRRAGFARGGSFANAVVVDNGQVLNKSGLRYADEFVRHKALDLLGDLYLAGAPIIGRITAVRPSHCVNNRFVAQLLDRRDAFVEAPAPAAAEGAVSRPEDGYDDAAEAVA